jgi:hypothetical protein
MCRRFGTLFLPAYTAYEQNRQNIEFRRRGITQKKEYGLNKYVMEGNLL